MERTIQKIDRVDLSETRAQARNDTDYKKVLSISSILRGPPLYLRVFQQHQQLGLQIST